MQKRLFLFNGITLIFLYGFFIDQSNYFNKPFLGLLLLVCYAFSAFFYSEKWHFILYHSVFILTYTAILLTSPMGITFALIAGLIFTVKVFLIFYLPAIILLIWNIKQLRKYKNT